MYKQLVNTPWDRQNLTWSWTYWDDLFTPEELSAIDSMCSLAGVEKSTIIGTQDEERVKQVRRSSVKFHKVTGENRWVFEKLNDVIEKTNELYFGFNLNGYDAFQYTEYYSEEQGKYDWHMDMCMGRSVPANMSEPRKLSMSMLLNEPGVDFEGGDFQVNTGSEQNAETVPFKRGRLVFFPSWVLHRVTPVTRGVRKSVVVWVTGPKFT